MSVPIKEEELDDEEVYKMASIMSSSGGLEAMLSRLDLRHQLCGGLGFSAFVVLGWGEGRGACFYAYKVPVKSGLAKSQPSFLLDAWAVVFSK